MTVLRVPVAGGELVAEQLPGRTEPVLAIHGISSHRRLWDWLHAEAPDLSLLTVDLRGRGDSVGLTGTAGRAQHVEDLIALLDARGLESVHVIGMSMGGFIAVELAHRHPERVKSLVLVDGGFPFATPEGLTPEAMPVVFADRLARLDSAHDSVAAYARVFAATAPMLDPADPLLAGYLAHDLDADGRVRLSGPALLDDAADIYFGEQHWDDLTVPVRWSYAEWSVGEGSTPMYPAEAAADYATRTVTSVFVPGVDHAGSIMTKVGAVVAAELLGQALAGVVA